MEGQWPCLWQFRRMRCFRHLLIHAIVALVCVFGALPGSAQVLPSLPKSSPGTSVPGVKQEGVFLTAPVTVDGAPVFRIASPATPSGGELPINVRLLYVQNAIAQILAEKDGGGTIWDPKTFKLIVDQVDKQQTLVATDSKHKGETGEVPILTVTSADAQYNNLPAPMLAEQWRGQLEHALSVALQKRQPQRIRQNLDALIRVSVALIVLTLAAAFGWLFLKRREAVLKKRIEDRQQQAEEVQAQASSGNGVSQDHQRRRLLATAIRAAEPERRLQRVHATMGFLVWIVASLWLAAVTWALLLFPQTTPYGQLIIHSTSNVLFIWIAAAVLNKLFDLIIVLMAEAYSRRGVTSEAKARHLLRAPTISKSVGGFKTFAVIFIAALATLSAINIPVASVVTIGGIAALAIGFAAQSLVRDFLNGMLVLFEDQYVVGDYVMIGDYNGIVENLTLRVVQIRDVRGHLITIPHSAVSQVVNASRNWSRVDFRIPIDAEADFEKAKEVLRSTIESLAKESNWRSSIIQPVEWIGIENISKNGIVLRAAVRTAPLRQFELNRVLNERVLDAFQREGIPLGADPLGPPVPSVQASPSPL